MNRRGQKPSLEGYTEPEAKKENMMNVGELDKKFFAENKPVKKRNKQRRRPQGNKPQVNVKPKA